MYVRTYHIYIILKSPNWSTHAYMCVVYVYVFACACIYIHICMYMYVFFTYIYIYIYIYMLQAIALFQSEVMRGVGAAAEEMLARAISEATNAKERKKKNV